MSWVNPPLVSEHVPGPDFDCVPCAGLMGVLAHHPGLAPATHAEAVALRSAARVSRTGGTSVEDIVVGIKRRYGLSPRIATTFSQLWSMLTAGNGAFVIIRPDRFPLWHPLRMYNGNYHGLHCIYVGRKGWRRRVWAIDPEGPTDGSYKGAWVSKSDLQKAFVGSAGVLSLHRI